MKARTFYPAALVLLSGAISAFGQIEDLVTLKSPDGRIEFRLLDGPPWDPSIAYPHLSYQIDFNGKRLIDTSHLGFDLDNALPLGHKLGLMTTSRETVDETYSLVSGKAKTVRNNYNEVVAEYLQLGSLGRRLNIEARVFNDGVAFRYVIPQTMNLETFRVVNEITEFVFAKDADAYPLLLSSFQTAYEDQYSKLALSRIHPDSLIGLPLLVEQPGVGWVAVTEADLDEYAGLYLQHGEGTLLRASLSPRVDGSGLTLQTKTPVVSPWRVFLIADTPVKLIESNIVTSLNRPTKLQDTSWIQPGKAVSASATTAATKSAIDFAGASGLQYVMIESGWAPVGNGNVPDLMRTAPEIDMPAILAQAKQRNVGIWLSTHWRSVESQMEEAFTLFEKWGVRGVQIDAMKRDDGAMVDFYHQVAAKAAEHHLMLDFHGSYKPDGMQRTFPNVLTFEAAMGSEYSKTTAAVTPEHDATLPFTRLLAGPLDYAPGGFNNATRDQFKPGLTQGTRAHQLALIVIFESALQTLSGDVKSYEGQKEFDFIRAVPTTWDETKAIAGEVGQYAVIARSRGADWYLGAITNWSPRELDIPLSFLGPGNYTADLYTDSGFEQRSVTASTALHLKLAAGGGTAIRFHR
jgi:alpha-glucosidase